ncbi:MAG: S1C family serine protease [Clostridia bacterium]|jgi:serine protease Do
MNNDFYEFDDERRYARRSRFWVYMPIILISAIIGGMLTYTLVPEIFNRFEAGNSLGEADIRNTVGGRQEDKGTDNLDEDLPVIGGKAAAIISSDNPVVDIAKQIGPSVVGVTNKVKGLARGRGIIEQEQGAGSGVIISEDGYIVTNNHVIEGASTVTVILPGGKEVNAQVIGTDPRSDLAVIKINEKNLTAAPMGDSSKIQVGELAVAIGNPLGKELAGTVTVGVISAVNRSIQVDGKTLNLIQTDAAINPGNSGGALVNSKGEVIGINTVKSVYAGISSDGLPISVEGIGFAIPSNTFRPIVEELIKHGYVSRPGIGISGRAVSEEEAKEYRVVPGILVMSVIADGPAAKANIQPGDIITKINGKEIKVFEDLTSEINKKKIGDQVRLGVWRDGKEYVADVILGELKE